MARELTPRQKKFVEEYLKSGNGTDAAIAAGYSAKTAASQASRLLADKEVQAYRMEVERELFEELGISAAWIGRRLAEVAERCMQGHPHMSWDPVQRQKVPDGLWVFDPMGATKALHELGVHIGMFRPDEGGGDKRDSFEEWLEKQSGKGSGL